VEVELPLHIPRETARPLLVARRKENVQLRIEPVNHLRRPSRQHREQQIASHIITTVPPRRPGLRLLVLAPHNASDTASSGVSSPSVVMATQPHAPSLVRSFFPHTATEPSSKSPDSAFGCDSDPSRTAS